MDILRGVIAALCEAFPSHQWVYVDEPDKRTRSCFCGRVQEIDDDFMSAWETVERGNPHMHKENSCTGKS